MRKTVLEMYFLNDRNFCVDSETPRLVYRHCSTLPPFKMKRLTTKLKVGLTRLLVGVFARLLADYFQQDNIVIVSRLNGKQLSCWRWQQVKDSLNKMFKQMTFTKKINNKTPDIETLALKFEVKIIKYKVLFAFYYPEDFMSDTLTAKILLDYEKSLRAIFKSCKI